ncbi:hypothetical protein IRZ83_14115 [Flavobacterium sp. JLP]|uniref:hypothetical protein n=1 Tax=Flavobacterium sp. JLP TaxID=2783793 RepID=UPI00188D221C|nr:hypothetical protein [Flavobacterium sp. JLP]MBF4507807.1 hypothetical protein [Flavobacterium sp. JLP]
MKIKILFLVFAIFCMNNLNAQHSSDEIQPNYIPPSPATASLGNFGNIPVGLNTGKPNINLEIFNLKDGNISVPISINYSSSGVAVDAACSQLGLEWSLIASGVVSRQVNGLDDFKFAFYSPDPNTTDFCSPSSVLAQGIMNSNTEKDIFNYSAFGISGKFIFDGDNIVQINPNKNKIELLNQTFSDGSVHKFFKITDTSGNEYYFGDNETSLEWSNNRNLCGAPAQTPSHTGWYLTKIKKTDGTTAYFKYNLKSFDFTQAYSQNAKAVGGILINDAAVGLPCVSSAVNHTIPYLEEIDINDKKIVFEYQKLDSHTEDSNQLTKITIYKNAVDILKTFDFSYYLIQRNNSSDVLNQYTTTAGLDTKLIFLKEVKEFTADRVSNISKFSFEYYNPEQLPPRFSFSKDIYGYYNAASNIDFVYNNLNEENGDFYKAFLLASANRNANPNTVYYGMLKSITYPTKGKTELVYEPNSVNIDKKFYPPSTTTDVAYQATGGLFANITVSEPITIPFNQTITLNGIADFYPTPGQNCTYADSHGAACTVELINMANNTVVKSILAEPKISVKVDLLAGTTYQIRVTTRGACVSTFASLVYHKDPVYTMRVNEPVAGVRVSKTLDYDDNGKVITKKYYYGSLECLNCSTGSFATINPAAEPSYDAKPLANNSGNLYTMYSGPKSPLSCFDGAILTYGKVIESYGENFENGGVLHIFDNNMDEPPASTCGDFIRGGTYSNGFYNGEISNLTFRKQGSTIIPISLEEMVYNHNSSLDVAFNNFFGGLAYTLNLPYGGYTDYFYNFNIYQVRSQWHYLSQKKSTVYDLNGLNPVTTITNFNYNNPNHLQLTSQTTTSSDAKLIETKYFYAQDTEMSNKPFVNDLIAKNIVGAPLDTQSFKAGNKLSEKLTVYENSIATNNLLLPKSIYAAKFPNALPSIANLGNLEKKITFDKYDDKGNVQQYTLESGSSVTFIWGYGKTQPIAKIENATIAEVATALGVSDLSTVNESNFTAINNLRTGLPNAMVTTYSYLPLVGVSTIIDPKGYKTTYTYDNFNRLEFVKDQDGKILSENQYHYKN